MSDILCAVCGVHLDPDDEAMFTTCQRCGNDVCIYCVDTAAPPDVCDHCADEMSETTEGKSEYELAEEWVLQLVESKFSYEQMNKVFQIVRSRYRKQLDL